MRGVNESISICVIDDDEAVRDSLAALLEPEGFIVKLYSSADTFLADLDKPHPGNGQPACLLLDLQMPGKGGQELLANLVGRDNRIPVVVMTGNTYERTKALALSNGAVAFLEKPVDADILIDTIRMSLRTR